MAFARALEARKIGRVRRCLVNKQRTEEQTATRMRVPAHRIAENLEIVSSPQKREAVVFVDDVITWGNRMAAVNHVLAWSGPTAAVCIAFTNDGDIVDCLTLKKRVIAYDASRKPWHITISKADHAS
jgi:predicted amidophosphoribosyltransferase